MPDPQELLRQRYGDATLAAPGAWSPALDCIVQHRSVRAYLPDPVSDAQLEAIMAAAQSAASSSNQQSWSVVAVRSQERRNLLQQYARQFAEPIGQAPLLLVWLADLSRLERQAAALDMPCEGIHYLDAFLTSALDAALAAQNATVAAESLGLGTVYIGGLRNQPRMVSELLGLPPRTFAIFGLCVGHPDPAHPTTIKPRLPQAAVLHHETYSTDGETAAITQYNATMKAFYESQKMNIHRTWAEHSLERFTSAQNMCGREQLVAVLRALGFHSK